MCCLGWENHWFILWIVQKWKLYEYLALLKAVLKAAIVTIKSSYKRDLYTWIFEPLIYFKKGKSIKVKITIKENDK